jgi:OmpA-OmpF porin, OOP family
MQCVSLIQNSGKKRSFLMNKKLLFIVWLLCLLTGCAEKMQMTVDRYQFDDLRDADGDGVINQRDICAGTPFDAKVDNDGCTFWSDIEDISWFPIAFKFDRSTLLEENKKDLDRAVEILNEDPQLKLVLIGDTSGEGPLKYNEALAQRRNQSVKVYLVDQGIQEQRIEMQTFDKATIFAEQLKERKRRTIAVFIDKHKAFDEAWHIYATEPETK